MALHERVKYDGPNDVLVWKFGGIGKDDFVMGSQVIVNESQEAIFFKGGQALDVLGAGTHTLSTKNLPILQKLVNLPFGGQTPFTAEVFYVNRTSKLDYKWGTKAPMQVEDPKYRILLNLSAFGQFGLRIEDSRIFVTQIVGTMPEWSSDKVLEYFRGLILTNVNTSISKFVIRENISISSISAFSEDLSKIIEEKVRLEFSKVGLSLLNFYISGINIPQDELRKIQDAQNQRFAIDQLGDKYETKRTFDVLEGAANNQGTIGGLMGAGLGLGIGAQMMSGASSILGGRVTTQQPPAPTQVAPPTTQPVVDKMSLVCRKCNSPVVSTSKFCPGCGEPLPAKVVCPSCGKEISDGCKFCGECGARVTQELKCVSCGAKLEPNTKFCAECGAKTPF